MSEVSGRTLDDIEDRWTAADTLEAMNYMYISQNILSSQKLHSKRLAVSPERIKCLLHVSSPTLRTYFLQKEKSKKHKQTQNTPSDLWHPAMRKQTRRQT